jgi:hypothetical protein
MLPEQERLDAVKRKLNKAKIVADEDTINARNLQLSEIAAGHAQIEQNTTQYLTIQRARDKN